MLSLPRRVHAHPAIFFHALAKNWWTVGYSGSSSTVASKTSGIREHSIGVKIVACIEEPMALVWLTVKLDVAIALAVGGILICEMSEPAETFRGTNTFAGIEAVLLVVWSSAELAVACTSGTSDILASEPLGPEELLSDSKHLLIRGFSIAPDPVCFLDIGDIVASEGLGLAVLGLDADVVVRLEGPVPIPSLIIRIEAPCFLGTGIIVASELP